MMETSKDAMGIVQRVPNSYRDIKAGFLEEVLLNRVSRVHI